MKKILKKKPLMICLCVALVLALSVGATLAYLSDLTGWKTNTFEFAEGLTITLNDEATNYKIIPGKDQYKETNIVVNNPDVPAYLYVVIKEENTVINNKPIVEWEIADGWQEMDFADPDIPWTDIMPEEMANGISADNTRIFWLRADAQDEHTFDVLKQRVVHYPMDLTKEDIPDGTEIKLSFAARAIQEEGFRDAARAWIGEEMQPVELPNSTMEPLNGYENIPVSDADGSWAGIMDAAVTFGTQDTEADIQDKEYKDWTVDFELTFNQDVDPASVHLFGSYDAYNNGEWLGEDLAAFGLTELRAGEPFRIMDAFGPALGLQSALTYTDITYIGEFNCGIAVENPAEGLSARLQLIMVDPEGCVYVLQEGNFPIN